MSPDIFCDEESHLVSNAKTGACSKFFGVSGRISSSFFSGETFSYLTAKDRPNKPSKLLTRNVFVTAKLGGKDESKALTKPDILNLVSSDVQQLESFVWTVGSIIELLLSSAIGCVFIWHLLGTSPLLCQSAVTLMLSQESRLRGESLSAS